jgi:cytochrome b6-f complex iron-sulfur subunit
METVQPTDAPEHSEMTRRTFLVMLLSMAGALGAAGLLAPIIRYAYPTVQSVAAAKLKVATTAQVAAGGGELDFDYQDTPSSLVKLEDGTYVGVSRVCTHLGCIIKWQAKDDRFFCPCHAGIFSPTGKVLGGPPPRPLAKLAVRVQGEDIWVDGWQSS